MGEVIASQPAGTASDADLIRQSWRQPDRFGAVFDRHAAAIHRRCGALPAPRLRRIWLSVDGTRPGLLREPGNPTALDPNPRPSLNAPTYRLLQSLPTNPHNLLERLYTDTKGSGPNPQQEVFVTIGDLVRESIAPPKVRAALNQAAALIPDVELVPSAVDAAGRHGVAVARTHDGERTELIFDRTTLQFLGERVVVVESRTGFPAGSVIGTSAVLRSAIVDRPGQLPR
jgi:hypothetical protein